MPVIYNNDLISDNCLFIAIGNSRIHLAWFKEGTLRSVWNTKHLTKKVNRNCIPRKLLNDRTIEQKSTELPVVIASVVPSQTKLWHDYSRLQTIALKDIKLTNTYPSMGIDRALSLWGGGENYGYPCLVIDGGTALTFTGANKQKELIGGAILPGLRTQFLSLNQKTAALPEVKLPASLPPRWAIETKGAIGSGIIHTVIAGIYSYILDWQQQYPDSQVIFTGGDAEILTRYLQQQYPDSKSKIKSDRNLIFYGMKLAIR